ncbi:MAG: carboxymuconolactone decarboxylase family protein, partial [Planctomycetes bacterium]|nr:carboxymuconolactone decarboxylase family protein [Planctomycetota bacterium]
SGGAVTLGAGVEAAMLEVCMDAQTSGGLLIALPEREARAMVLRLHEDGVADAAIIGRVRSKGTGRIFLETRGERVLPEVPEAALRQAPAAGPGPEADAGEGGACCGGESGAEEATMTEEGCCADGAGAEAHPMSATGAGVKEAFQAFLKQSGAPGALDAATKQAVAIALSVYARCDPCVRAHIRKARKMGFSQEEIDEAAWMGIAFGGSPVMMFYEGVRDA